MRTTGRSYVLPERRLLRSSRLAHLEGIPSAPPVRSQCSPTSFALRFPVVELKGKEGTEVHDTKLFTPQRHTPSSFLSKISETSGARRSLPSSKGRSR